MKRARQYLGHLESIWLSTDVQLFVEKLDADGVEGMCVETVGDEAIHETGLAHAAIPQQNTFE